MPLRSTREKPVTVAGQRGRRWRAPSRPDRAPVSWAAGGEMGAESAGGGVLWLALAWGVFVSQAACQAPPQGFRVASYEVIIPKRIGLRRGRVSQDLAYLLEIEGKSLVVHLRQKRGLIPKHFPVFTYSKEGELQVDYPFVRADCFYHGFVEGRSSSLVALSSCSGGLRGLLMVESKTYEIEPVPASATFQHVVYLWEEKEHAVRMRCGLTEKEQNHQISVIQNTVAKISLGGVWWSNARYAKVAVVVEHERYVQFGRNETAVVRQVLDAIHIADSLYKALGVHVAMVGLEIWSQRNLIEITGSLDELLDIFNTWRRMALVQHLRHDVGHLFVYKHFGVKLGLSFVGTVCDPIWASAVEVFITSSLFSFSVTFAHQLGHNLGMQHDEKYCTCNQHSCIMTTSHSITSKFSNCSYNSYSNLINSGRKQCLLIPPEHEKLYELKNCGNKVVESGEQCDCGSPVHCQSDVCCQPNCMLHSGATCAVGTCCANCQYLPAGTVCRERTSICDLPEYCTGISEWCPEDVHVQDGAPCQDNAICYHGKCSTHNNLCQMIFGKRATVAPLGCFREVNARGDRFGNCGLVRANVYKKCENSNILCGKIQCININEVPNLNENGSVIQTPLNSDWCWGTAYHSGAADIGAVRDGTRCGSDMMCINRECIKVSLLNYDCNQSKCHNRGRCNSLKNCHCSYGWAPPYCLTEGYGGSIDSGPPPPKSGSVEMTRAVIILSVSAAGVLGTGVGVL
ncbi:disintegrin and metalloproteinase domain-containing protein 20-like [Paroedura picta]|uniref:disintegrin and metalloproteinase domain-containing protein 20-like n=1 Tax=Paroedura picta TaxID=143630 RepID=UPI0040573044